MNILDYYEVVTSKIFKLESMNEGLVLIAPEQEVGGVRSLMVGCMYLSMNDTRCTLSVPL